MRWWILLVIVALTEAAAAGAGPAQDMFDRGAARYRAQDHAGAFALFMQAANAGNLRAQLQVASQYERGEGVPRDEAAAVRWYRRSAEGGDAQAMKNLGLMHEEGRGTPENWAEAARWYRQSAERGDASGEFALGRMYEFGMAVPQDRAQAIDWFQRAGRKGNGQAAYFARWLATPTNNIGFRNEAEHQLVIGNRLRFSGELLGGDPAGIAFRNSGERLAWLQGQRGRVDRGEAQTLWSVRRADYDSCMRAHRGNCFSPGPPPR